MVFNMTQEIPSAQPRPQTPVSSPVPTQEHSRDLIVDDINVPFAVLNNDLLTEPYNNDQNNQSEFERGTHDQFRVFGAYIRFFVTARSYTGSYCRGRGRVDAFNDERARLG